jgi:hypothetical protein
MKIYNEVTSIFNENTGLWETISEDSFDYSGPMALAIATDNTVNTQAVPSHATPIDNALDTIEDTVKTTTGYFTNGDGTLEGTTLHTGSLADGNEKYYFNVVQTHPASSSAETQFSVTFGHSAGSGSDAVGDTSTANTLKTQSEAIYKQFASILLPESEASGGFKISAQGSSGIHTVGTKDDYIYVLVGKRARMKDRINKKVWKLSLSGSLSTGVGTDILQLTDDSAYNGAVATPAGPRYNIVSGALGNVNTTLHASTIRTYGWFYPDQALMIFSGAELSASIPGIGRTTTAAGGTGTEHITASFGVIGAGNKMFYSSSGFAPNLDNTADSQNSLRFVNCMKNMGSSVSLRMRAEEDLTQENYFCRVTAGNYNFTNNPTWTSGSSNKIKHSTMRGNPTTFITGVGLYSGTGALMATAKLSSPIKKNFVSEATIKVKLTY